MGNCLRKNSFDPNNPSDATVHPPTDSRGKFNRYSYPALKTVHNAPAPSNTYKAKRPKVNIPRDMRDMETDRGSDTKTNLPYQFEYNTLLAATNKFSEKSFLGQGGFGDVHKGFITIKPMKRAEPTKNIVIAVKRLRRIGDGHREWENELTVLSGLNHPNIVKLVGFCNEGHHRLLVYEYMIRGSLEAHLLKEGNHSLTWCRRIQIALGAAQALHYLHNCSRPVIHRDLKASNVLLDADFKPKISDFGLAKYAPGDDESHVTSRILGTMGYFAPEYATTGHLTLKTDIYSFGVVLLEIFCGSGAVMKHSDGCPGYLAKWARPDLSNRLRLRRVIDKKLRGSVNIEEAYEFAQVINRCLSDNPNHRPTMSDVVADLEQLQLRMEYTSTHPCMSIF
ncbi:hypothetical protein ACFE04_024671 [Oxalis oulophora]